MKKQILIFILGIVLLNCIYAIEINSGENYSLSLAEPYSYYEIAGNSSGLDLNITQENLNVTVFIGKYSPSDNFTITFYNERDEVIASAESSGSSVSSSSSGGGICYRGWTAGNWSECISNIQTRNIKLDYKICYLTRQDKPVTNQSCSLEPIIPENNTIIPQEPIRKEFFLWTWLKWLLNKLMFWKK